MSDGIVNGENEFDDDVVRLPWVAKFLDMCERNAGEKARKGIIPSVKIDGSRRFSKKAVRAWFERKMGNGQTGK